MVKPPSTPGTIWFLMRILAKVPRIITSWLPRRVPYWLKSSGLTLWSMRYLPAGEATLIEPPGGEGVGGDRIEQQTQHARIDDVDKRLGPLAHADEIRRVLHVGRLLVPPV